MSAYVPPAIAYDHVTAESVRCRNDSVLIRWAELPDTTPSGLVALPKLDCARDIDGRLAVVVAAGPGPSYTSKCPTCEKPRGPLFQMDVKPGDKVIADGRMVGELLYIDGVEHRMVRLAELLAVVEDDDGSA
jgi:co-chaperonin GroES (HSP10)